MINTQWNGKALAFLGTVQTHRPTNEVFWDV